MTDTKNAILKHYDTVTLTREQAEAIAQLLEGYHSVAVLLDVMARQDGKTPDSSAIYEAIDDTLFIFRKQGIRAHQRIGR